MRAHTPVILIRNILALICNSQSKSKQLSTIGGTTCPTTKYNHTGWIYSPGYPSNYGRNVHCTYDITCSDGEIVDLEFFKFKTLNGTDFLDLDDGIRLLR